MDWISSQTKHHSFLSQPSLSPPSSGFSLNNKVSPSTSILIIVIILSIIFFISGLLHLLVRFLFRPPNRDHPDDSVNATALQGQLQQLFHLHDSGVDQSFIDALPIFNYKAITGVKNPFDCAVCLCEFELEDKLRLLPKCSHAFHMGCIDTWLLSHSTCPLCRGSLLADFSPNRHICSPMVLVLESGRETARENVSERDGVLGTPNSVARANSHLGFHFRDEVVSPHIEFSREIEAKGDENGKVVVGSDEKVVAVKLGKFRNVDGGGGGEGSSSENNVGARRCFSMGSFAYIMDENSLLQVPIRTPNPMKKQSSKKPSLLLTPGHRPAMSECEFDSRRESYGFESFKSVVDNHGIDSSSGSISNGNGNGKSKRESFSLSKTWLRAKRENPNPTFTDSSSSRRAFSFRFPVHRNVVGGDDIKPKIGGSGNKRTPSEIDIGRWENGGGSELDFDEENQSCCSNSLDSQANPPSFARRTLLWLVGKQNKVVDLSSSLKV